jgi:L-alanine-DL-glutamate epimerase-like enolase superfamily enzyme
VKIVAVDLSVASWPIADGARLPGRSREWPDTDLGYLRLVSDEGFTGESLWGALDTPASLDAPHIARWLRPLLVGEDPRQRERLNAKLMSMARYTGYRAVGAVDLALWDLFGKAAAMPLNQLIGSYREALPAYASSQIFDEPGPYLEQAMELKERGWRGYKVHPPKTPNDDLAIARDLRSALGEHFMLTLDGAWSYGLKDALYLGRGLSECAYEWLEDPLRQDDIYGYQELRSKLDIAVVATEQPEGTLESYVPWVLMRATSALRGDVATRGGITAILKAAHLAEAFGMNYELHYGGNAFNDAVNVHIGACLKNTEYVELQLPEPVHAYGLAEGSVVVDAYGMVRPGVGHGVGVTVDPEVFCSNKTTTF